MQPHPGNCETCGQPLTQHEGLHIEFRGGKAYLNRRAGWTIYYECRSCWYCPSCEKKFRQDQECECEPCAGCGNRPDWNCTCPRKPYTPLETPGAILDDEIPF